jgi:hypothetical protein
VAILSAIESYEHNTSHVNSKRAGLGTIGHRYQKIMAQELLEHQTRDLENSASREAVHRFRQQAFVVATCMLDAMEGALNVLTNTVPEMVQFRWILVSNSTIV